MPLIIIPCPVGRASGDENTQDDPLGWQFDAPVGCQPMKLRWAPPRKPGEIPIMLALVLGDPSKPVAPHKIAFVQPGQMVEPFLGRRLEFWDIMDLGNRSVAVFRDLPWPKSDNTGLLNGVSTGPLARG